MKRCMLQPSRHTDEAAIHAHAHLPVIRFLTDALSEGPFAYILEDISSCH